MIDRHYGALARNGGEHPAQPPRRAQRARIRAMDAAGGRVDFETSWERQRGQQKGRTSKLTVKPSDGLEPSTPSIPWNF